MGLVPARGRWSYERFATASAATFRQGSLVQLNTDRDLSEYSGGENSFLGIAMQNSVNSLPAGYVVVALPTDGACTAFADLPTGVAASSLSLGQAYGLTKSGNTVSQLTTSFTSTGGKIVVIRGAPVLSPISQIEVGFLTLGSVYHSSASQTIA
jgi:hypothetical protein